MFTLDQLGLIKPELESVILKERHKYDDIYGVIEEYISKNSSEKHKNTKNIIIIGGITGLNLLLENERKSDQFVYDLYSENALYHANEMSNLLAKYIKKAKKNYIVRLQTAIAYRSYNVYVDNRLLVSLYSITGASKSEKGYVTAFEIIQPIYIKFKSATLKSDANYNVFVVPPEMHLIDIYRSLYSPYDAGQWENNVEIEQKLLSLLDDRKKILGGAEPKITTQERNKIQQDIMSEFVYNNRNVVLIGEHALEKIYEEMNATGDFQTTSPVINIISYGDLDQDIEKIKSIVKGSVPEKEIPVIYISRGLKVMKDFRVQRITVKIGGEFDQKEVMYIYNSAHYDLIPFNKYVQYEQFLQIGNPYIILRFLLIDIWIIRWIQNIGSINEEFAKARLQNIFSNVMKLSKLVNKIPGDTLDTVFQKDRYTGIYQSDKTAQKLEKMEGIKFSDYYPQEYHLKNKSYRDLK